LNYALFFGSFLLVMLMVWLPMPSERPKAPVRAYRHAFLTSAGLLSSLGILFHFKHWASEYAAVFAVVGALVGGFIATLIDIGIVENPVPSAVRGAKSAAARRAAGGPGLSRRRRLELALRAVGALIALAVTVPALIVIGVLIWLEEPGPVLLAKEVERGDGGAFRRLGFRTTKYEMEPGADVAMSPADDRSTLKIGWLLRRSRLEKLPQPIGVLAFSVSLLRPSWLRTPRRTVAIGEPAGMPRRRTRRRLGVATAAAGCAVLTAAVVVAVVKLPELKPRRPSTAAPVAMPHAESFDVGKGAVLPNKRVVAFYGIPGVPVPGPAYMPDEAMLERLRAQGAEYERLDPAHPVALGIDVVVSVPDGDPGPDNIYSHRVDTATLDRYVEFCRSNGLLLFLDLSFGWADPRQELERFMPYLALPFVHLAIDPEWMFPRHNGVPGVNLSNVRAADLNPLITAMADLPARLHIPRKIVILHQFRPTGDELTDPYDPGAAEIADKANLVDDPRVDVVVHIDSVGGWPGDIQAKTQQYTAWVRKDMARFGNFRYGGFKIFYQIESKNRLMTPAEVMKLKPPPMVITYGN
jgi:hypothetical protein